MYIFPLHKIGNGRIIVRMLLHIFLYDSITDEVFLPKEANDADDHDDFDREIEEFKR